MTTMLDNNGSLSSARNLSDGASAIKVGLGLLLFLFFLVTISIAQADGLFDFQMKLAKKGNPEAEFKIGEMYETGFGVKKDMKEARVWIEKAAAQGHETARFKLLYWDIEKNGVTASNKAGIKDIQTKAESGNPQAQYYLGKMHAYGVGVKKDPNKAMQWLNKAALVGVLEAEREIPMVREEQQKMEAAAKRRAEEKRRAEMKARQERERKAREEQRKLREKQLAEQRKKAELEAQKNKAAAEARAKAEKEAAEKARKKAEQEALARKQAEAKRREAEKQALMKKRAEQEKKRKAQFESDPCSGKSARFLSTCK